MEKRKEIPIIEPAKDRRETNISPLLRPALELVNMKNAEGLIEPTEEQLRSTPPFVDIVDEEYDRHMNKSTMTYWTRPTKFVDLVIDELNLDKEAHEKVKRYFKNKPLVDLGAGISTYGYSLSADLGSSSYIAVEPYFFKTISNNLNSYANKYDKYCQMPFAVVKEDALTFLRRLEDNSACIISCGLDENIIGDKEYAAKVSEEISRVIGKDNAFISQNCMFAPSNVSCQEIGRLGALLYKRNLKTRI